MAVDGVSGQVDELPRAAPGHRHRLARRVARIADSSRYLPFLGGPPAVAYVGWSGKGNLGDEAMLQAHRRLLGGHPLRQLPNLGDTLGLRLVSARGGISAVCLGGGTLIYNGYFRTALDAVLRAAPDVPRIMLSVGVEDPGYTVGRRAAVAAEPPLWQPLLRQFPHVNVRGPLSAQALERIDVAARVVGDPALGIELPSDVVDPLRSPEAPEVTAGGDGPPTIGVNVGITDDLWGQDQGRVLGEVRELTARMVGRGWRVRLIATTSQDEVHLRTMAEAVPGLVGPNSSDLDSTVRAIAGCDVLVGEKLHSLVLAARVGVPAIAMEYRPKCRDFQESVERGRYTVTTGEMTAGLLLDLVDEVTADLAGQTARLRFRAARLVDTLEEAALQVGRDLLLA